MSGGVRYSAQQDFSYNGRVSLALLPCLATLVALAGRPCLVTLTIGAMVAYSMDTLQVGGSCSTSAGGCTLSGLE